MPTKKPLIQSVVRNITYNKFKKIAEIEERSISQLGAKAIEQYIADYEVQHGEIMLPTENDDLQGGDKSNRS